MKGLTIYAELSNAVRWDLCVMFQRWEVRRVSRWQLLKAVFTRRIYIAGEQAITQRGETVAAKRPDSALPTDQWRW